ncbi:sortase [Candidatus Kaiserbacteria bacterium]|nr:MAG: sortase [Candidatus Kaiserbacteria bacterium]
MEYKPDYNSQTIAATLFKPKILWALAIAWLALVIIGSIITVSAANTGLNDREVEALLSENERLALATNVAYNETNRAQALENNAITVFPDRLVVPSLGIDLPISNPQTRDIQALDEELKTAAVRYPDSAKLGEQGGNVLLFGHSSRLPIVRNQLFKAFNDIEKLSEGNIIQAHSGTDVYSYRVSRVYQANATDDKIALDVEGHRLTLLTCDSFGAKSDRWVVEAEFLGKNI